MEEKMNWISAGDCDRSWIFQRGTKVPTGAKAQSLFASYGTTKVVPCYLRRLKPVEAKACGFFASLLVSLFLFLLPPSAFGPDATQCGSIPSKLLPAPPGYDSVLPPRVYESPTKS